MSKKVKKILSEVSTANFPNLKDLVSGEIKEGSYDSLTKKQMEIRAEKLRDALIEDVLDKAKECKLAWEDFLGSDEERCRVTSKLIIDMTLLESAKRALRVIDELVDKLLADEEQK